MAPPPRRQAPSWVGTLVVAVAVIVMLWLAAARLRRAVDVPASGDAGVDDVNRPRP